MSLLLLDIYNILPKNFHLTHVKEHQDNLKISDELTIPERLNIEADIIATSKTKTYLNIALPSASLAIYVHQKYIHLNFKQNIRASYFENEAKSILQSTYNWDTSTI